MNNIAIEEVRIIAPIKREYDYFLRGPIPFSWLARAANLRGKSFQVSVLIWFHYFLLRKPEFKIQKKFREKFGVGRKSFYSSLAELEEAGLIKTISQKGSSRTIQIIEESGDE